jgi:hypothetical protein
MEEAGLCTMQNVQVEEFRMDWLELKRLHQGLQKGGKEDDQSCLVYEQKKKLDVDAILERCLRQRQSVRPCDLYADARNTAEWVSRRRDDDAMLAVHYDDGVNVSASASVNHELRQVDPRLNVAKVQSKGQVAGERRNGQAWRQTEPQPFLERDVLFCLQVGRQACIASKFRYLTKSNNQTQPRQLESSASSKRGRLSIQIR